MILLLEEKKICKNLIVKINDYGELIESNLIYIM